MANYLITGGAGFIGSNIAEFLVEQGESVRVLDCFVTGCRENLAKIEKRIEIIEGDVCDRDVCRIAVEDMDFVLHQAAIPSVPRSIERPVESATVNVIGTVNLLEAAARAKIQRFVFAASSSAYGDQEAERKSESLMPAPKSPYAAAKLAGEHFCAAFAESFGLHTVALRYFNVFGPRQDPNSPYSAVVPLFIRSMMMGRAPTIFGDGLQSRDFTYIENVIEANIAATRAGKDSAGRVFNVGCGKSYSLLNLVAALNQIMGTKIEAQFAEARTGDVRHSLADISAARSALGYDVRVDFEEGLRRTVEWHKTPS